MKQAYLSKLAGLPLKTLLQLEGYKVNLVNEYGQLSEYRGPADYLDPIKPIESEGTIHVDPRIATHADLYMCQLGLWNDAGLFFGDPEKLSPDYPGDVLYNAVCTRDYYIHLVPGTDEDLVGAMMTWRKLMAATDKTEGTKKSRNNDDEHLKIVGVSQGYTRCTCLPVDDNSFITSDDGLAKILENQGANVLKISTGHIKLEGFDYGFIGGCAGHIYVHNNDAGPGTPTLQRAIVFNGDLSKHPDFWDITDFIQSRNIHPVYFNSYPLEDIGSILATHL